MVFASLKQRREVKRLRRILKKLAPDALSSFRRVSSDDQIESLRYLIVSKIKECVLFLEHALQEKERMKPLQKNHFVYLHHKLSKVYSKLAYFATDFDEEEFKKIYALLGFIERDIRYV